MNTSPEPAQAPLLLAELCYFDIPRDSWLRTLLRARQLGIQHVSTFVRWKWHAPTSDLIDLSGISNPQSDLIEFVKLCSRLSLALTLHFGAVAGDGLAAVDLPPWLAVVPFSEHARGVNAPRHTSELPDTARSWIAACSHALLPYQAPGGPIVALRHTGGALLDGWLRHEGWAVPIAQAEPAHSSQAAHLPAGWLGDLANAAPLSGAVRTPLTLVEPSAPALLRSDGSARPSFWRAKSVRMLVGAAGSDLATVQAPADLALLADLQLEPLAQRLASDGFSFDWIDPADAAPARLARYALVVAPGAVAEQLGLQATLAGGANLALVGEYQPGNMLGGDVSSDEMSELLEARGGHARYAWADNSALELSVRYGAEYIYLAAHNRLPVAYNGMLAYRAPGGEVLHLHIGIGAGRAGLVILREDEVVGVAFDGDGAEAGWLARGLTSSVVFNAGAGGVAPYDGGLLIMSSQSGRFQIRRKSGWSDMRAHRLLLSGELSEARAQIDATHLLLPYTAEDDRGQTDLYIVASKTQRLPPTLRGYLAAPLHARALELQSAAELAGQITSEAATLLALAAHTIAEGAARLDTLDDYAATWRQAAEAIQSAAALLEAQLGASRADEHSIGRIARLISGDG